MKVRLLAMFGAISLVVSFFQVIQNFSGFESIANAQGYNCGSPATGTVSCSSYLGTIRCNFYSAMPGASISQSVSCSNSSGNTVYCAPSFQFGFSVDCPSFPIPYVPPTPAPTQYSYNSVPTPTPYSYHAPTPTYAYTYPTPTPTYAYTYPTPTPTYSYTYPTPTTIYPYPTPSSPVIPTARQACLSGGGLPISCEDFPDIGIDYCLTNPLIGTLYWKDSSSWVKMWVVKSARNGSQCSDIKYPYYFSISATLQSAKPGTLKVVYSAFKGVKPSPEIFKVTVAN